jgi:P27 family predicted phage terminase small subunit
MPRGSGRRPEPTVSKRLRGNPGKRPLNTREPVPPPFEPGEIPPEIEGDARAVREWHRLAPMLTAIKQITEADRSAMIAACLEWSRYIKASRNASAVNYAKASGGHSVWFAVQRHALAACMKLWAELGLTPSARTRVKMAETPGAGGDEFSEFDRPADVAEDDSELTH